MRNVLVISMVIAAACAHAGCSLGISGPRAGTPVSVRPKCDTGRGAIVGDGLLAAIGVIGGAVAFSEEQAGLGIVGLAFGGLMVASAIHGNSNARDCEQAMARHDRYVEATLAAKLEAPKRAAPLLRMRPQPEPAAEPAQEPVQEPAQETQPQPQPQPDDEWAAFWELVP